jgi:hypothetical protein
LATSNKNVKFNVTATNRASGVRNKVQSELRDLETVTGGASMESSVIAGAFAVGAITYVVGQIGSPTL